MQLDTVNMNEQFAYEILYWHYEPPYDFYNSDPSPEGMKELFENTYVVLVDENGNLVGFYCKGPAAQVPAGREFKAYPEGFIDVGLGMNPKLTGRGFGKEFFSFILNDISLEHPGCTFRLTVAAFNLRAITLYRKEGFKEICRFQSGFIEYIVMTKISSSSMSKKYKD
ncbi:GNAT family N-acetyltransferase [Bacillus sp. EB01]|uniref:GNAT family N-acetyltransferase n=1 Tax=Bacillus sp. EB01 TaxID=1347086 RepID=UPI0005C7330B|nr:GNAT family N-acetyltransferase [Bacillus sp. EB01]